MMRDAVAHHAGWKARENRGTRPRTKDEDAEPKVAGEAEKECASGAVPAAGRLPHSTNQWSSMMT